MRKLLRLTAVATALCALALGAVADVNRTTFAARYADYQRKQALYWSIAYPLWGTPLQPIVNRVLSRELKVARGHLNPTNTPLFGDDLDNRQAWLNSKIGITTAHATSTGRDVVVAVLDGGFNLQHPWIASRVLPYGYDAVSHDWDPQDRGNGVDDDHDGTVDDCVGHGTFVAGMIVSVAPDAWILPVRIADDEGNGLEEELLSGIDFAISMGVNVINISYEVGTITVGVRDKLRQAAQAGITVVVSAGNDGSDAYANQLAAEGTTIGVGATDDSDVVATFSNAPSNGNGLGVFAPGVNLYGPHGGPTNTACCTWSGTSFSAPLVSGAVALALQVGPTRTPQQLGSIVRSSTVPVTAWDGTTYAWAGRISLPLVVQQ